MRVLPGPVPYENWLWLALTSLLVGALEIPFSQGAGKEVHQVTLVTRPTTPPFGMHSP